MTPATIRRLSSLQAVMGRAIFPHPPKWVEGGAVDITLRMSRTDFADIAWAVSRSPDERPGAFELPQNDR